MTFFIGIDKDEFDDKQLYILKQINGFDISNFEFSSEFEKLNDKGKIKIIFKKENMKNYRYKLNGAQLMLIEKINQIRRKNNILELNYNSLWQELPAYIINNKTELIF